MTCVGRLAVTSWTNSTSPRRAASCMISRQISRTRPSICAITRALKLGASGRRYVDVLRWIHREQHHPHAFERLGSEVLEHDAGLVRGVERRLLGDVDDVRVLEHGPVTRFARHLLPEDGLGAAQLGEQLVRRAAAYPSGS